jgi:inosine-uridine nucleoside N-ribohydrolase
MPRKIILDVDTGTDDAVAIMLAALHPAIELVGCTTVNGNVEVEFATDNTLRVLDHIGRSDVLVHEGLPRPIARTDFPVPRQVEDLAGKYHARTLPVPPTRRHKAATGATEFLIETFRAATQPITLVAVAPLSNLAATLQIEPGFAKAVPELVVMGGGHEIGNVTPAAEFNVWADPEAASTVFSAGFQKLTLLPLDATHRALVSRRDCDRFAALGTPAGLAAAEFIGHRIGVHDAVQKVEVPHAAPVHDALAVAAVIDPTLITTRRFNVAVETDGDFTVGRTVIDTHFRSRREPNCWVAFDADAPRFVDLLAATFAAAAPERRCSTG